MSTDSADPDCQQRQAILLRSQELFMTIGVRSVTMDDVAKELGISKKTLYKHVQNKGDLVEQTMRMHVEAEECSLQAITQEAENAIDSLLLTTAHISEKLASINPAVVFDTQRYYPESWALFDQHKHRYIYRHVLENLHRGMDEGLYRQDLDTDVMARIYVGRVEVFFDTKLFPPTRYRLPDVYAQFMNYHIRGLASAEGVAYLESRGKALVGDRKIPS